MDSRTFYNHVVEMREFQKEYFATRSRIALYKAKEIEQIIDAEIDRVSLILEGKGEEVNINTKTLKK